MPDNTPERALISAVLADQSKLPLADGLSGADFADPDLGKLWDALLIVDGAGQPIGDSVLLLPKLASLGVSEAVRSVGFIRGLLADALPWHAQYYARQIREAAEKRRLLALACDLVAKADNPSESASDVRAWIDARLAGIAHCEADPVIMLHKAALQFVDDVKRAADEPRAMATTGLGTVDSLAGGWLAGELIILAARPGCGKTAFATQVAIHNAAENRPVLVASLEMRQAELAGRVIAAEAGIDGRLFRANRHNSDDVQAIESAAQGLEGLAVHLWAPRERNKATVSRLRGVAKMQAARGGLGLLVVDYLQLLAPVDRRIQRHEQIGQMTADLKSLAHELGCPVLCLAQLSREAEKATEPQLSHLRESGSIEQDADLVLFIHHGDERGTELHVAKHRHGTTGVIPLEFRRRETRFCDVTPETFDDS